MALTPWNLAPESRSCAQPKTPCGVLPDYPTRYCVMLPITMGWVVGCGLPFGPGSIVSAIAW